MCSVLFAPWRVARAASHGCWVTFETAVDQWLHPQCLPATARTVHAACRLIPVLLSAMRRHHDLATVGAHRDQRYGRLRSPPRMPSGSAASPAG